MRPVVRIVFCALLAPLVAAIPAGAAPSPTGVAVVPMQARGVAVVRPVAGRPLPVVAPQTNLTWRRKCGTPVVAAHPGTAAVDTRPEGTVVSVTATPGGLTTVHRYVGRVAVTTGQLIQAGQRLGTVARVTGTSRCETALQVLSAGKKLDTAGWLRQYAGRPVPSPTLFDDTGFNLATFNVLGAFHTGPFGSKAGWPDYQERLPTAIAMLDAYDVDVAGLQELQPVQRSLFGQLAGSTWDVYPDGPGSDPENAIIWRRERFTFVSGATFPIPYLNGRTRYMPYVLLRDDQTGRTAYFINVHNPASNTRVGNHAGARAEAVRRERALVISLRAEGRPVFLTGDFNDRRKVFCAMTTGKLMISPESVPSTGCAMPKYYWVDWIFAAGQARFTRLTVDTSPKARKLSDHPVVVARAHLAD